MAATPANARLPLIVEAAPVNLGGAGVVVFFGGIGVPVPAGGATVDGFGGAMLDELTGQAVTVTVTTDGTTGMEVTAGGGATDVLLLNLAGQLVTEEGQAVTVPVMVLVMVPVIWTGNEVVDVTVE